MQGSLTQSFTIFLTVQFLTYCSTLSLAMHRWEIPDNYPVFNVVMVSYHYVERIWRILVTPNFLYNIYNQ